MRICLFESTGCRRPLKADSVSPLFLLSSFEQKIIVFLIVKLLNYKKMKRNYVFKAAMLVIALVMVAFGSAKAQEAGDMAVGGNLGISTGSSVTSFGVGGKFQYGITKDIRGEGSFSYFLGDFKYWDLSVNAHYLIGIPSVEKLKVYPLAGLSLVGTGGGGDGDGVYYGSGWDDPNLIYDEDGVSGGSGTSFGFNIGAGGQYQLTDKLYLQGELKYRIGETGFSKFMVVAGVAYKF